MGSKDAKVVVCDSCGAFEVVPDIHYKTGFADERAHTLRPEGWTHSANFLDDYCPRCSAAEGGIPWPSLADAMRAIVKR